MLKLVQKDHLSDLLWWLRGQGTTVADTWVKAILDLQKANKQKDIIILDLKNKLKNNKLGSDV